MWTKLVVTSLHSAVAHPPHASSLFTIFISTRRPFIRFDSPQASGRLNISAQDKPFHRHVVAFSSSSNIHSYQRQHIWTDALQYWVCTLHSSNVKLSWIKMLMIFQHDGLLNLKWSQPVFLIYSSRSNA